MPPRLASLLTWIFIIFLFRRELLQKPNVTRALWIPFFWFVILCSRPVSVWLNMFGLPVPGGSSVEAGTPVDACFQLGLIAAGLFVLVKRGITLAEFFRNNIWITLFLGYCFLSVFWSDYTFVAMKRWVKDLGLPIMALVVLSEPDPMTSLAQLMKRCAYIIIPVSVLFIKYYPEWGRYFDPWSGAPGNSGINTDKNFLGVNCLLTCFFFVWYLMRVLKVPPTLRDKAWRNELLLCVGFLSMIGWLFQMSNSKTPLVALSVGLLVMFLAGWRRIRKEYIGGYLVAGVILVFAVQLTFDVYGNTLKLLGRQPTLTGRTVLWHDLMKLDTDPIIGVGFESFWMGWQEKLPELWETKINESHNGYLETYLTLGMIGVALLLGVLVSTYRRACAELLNYLDWGQFRLGYFVAFIIYSCTEAGFRGLHPMMQMFYLIALNYPKPQLNAVAGIFTAQKDNAETQVDWEELTIGTKGGRWRIEPSEQQPGRLNWKNDRLGS